MTRLTYLFFPLFPFLLCTGHGGSSASTLTALTFNIRYGTAKDEGHTWDVRKDAVAEVLRAHNPDLAGLQEALDFQVEFLRTRFEEEYGVVGEGREGGTRGEYAPIFYRSDRFVLAKAGRFWLSDTPEAVGSKSWSSLPRMVTWVELIDRASQRRLVVSNTHWAHDSDEARFKSANLMRERMREIAPEGSPALLMGDFNCVADSDPHRALVNDQPGGFKDSFSFAKTNPKPTFHGFRPRKKDGAPIDWILFRGKLEPTEFQVLEGEYLGELPSDHYPVFVSFNW